MKSTLAIITLNEAESVPIVLPKIQKDWVDEMIVVDGGSTDGTIEWCRKNGYEVLVQKRPGYGQGMRELIGIAHGEVIIEFMGDGNCDPATIPRLIEKMREGYDLVIASRYTSGAKSYDDTWITRLGNWGFTAMVNILFGASYTDAMNGYRAYRIDSFKKLNMDEDGLTFPTQGSIQFAKAGLKIAEIPTNEPKRIGGVRKAKNIRTGLQLLYMIIREYARPLPVPLPKLPRARQHDTSGTCPMGTIHSTESNFGSDTMTPTYTRTDRCRVCGSSDLTEVLSLGDQFLASSFVKSNTDNPLAAMRFPLTLILCDRTKNPQGCGVLQLKETVKRDLLYRKYFYRSATNPMMHSALREIAQELMARISFAEGDAVLDIGCNDGTMLTFFPPSLQRFGIDPAENISPLKDLDPSIRILTDYFSHEAARKVSGGLQTFKAIASIAMFYDLDDPHSFVRDVKKLLHPGGIWCIQLSWLYDVIRNMNFFDICHEHLLYYSLGTLRALLHLHDLEIIDASTNPVNGGSLRVFVRHKKAGLPISPNVQKILDEEIAFGLNEPANTFREFSKKISDLKKDIVGYLRREKERGGMVVGLGASTKGNVLLQYFGIGKDLVPYLCDRNPEKIGLRTLGTDIEVISEERMRKLHPSCLLVLIWFFREELLKRERSYLDKGGAMLFPMPHPHIITKEGETPLPSAA